MCYLSQLCKIGILSVNITAAFHKNTNTVIGIIRFKYGRIFVQIIKLTCSGVRELQPNASAPSIDDSVQCFKKAVNIVAAFCGYTNRLRRNEIAVCFLITLVIHKHKRLPAATQLVDQRFGHGTLTSALILTFRRIRYFNNYVGVLKLIQGRFERFDKMCRQSVNKAYRIGKQHILTVRKLQTTRCRIERRKQLILGKNARAGKIIQQC